MNSAIAAQQNVGAAAGHVGRDGDRALASRLRHDLGFVLVILGVQHHVLHALFLQMSESRSDFSTDVVPTSTGCPFSASFMISSAAAKYFSFSVR